MALSYPLFPPDWPDIEQWVSKTTLRMVEAIQVTESPFSLKHQAVATGGARWEIDVQLREGMRRADASPWLAFLGALQGGAKSFYLGDVDAINGPLGTGSGNPKVGAGAAVGDRTLATTGWSAGSRVLKAGDYITVQHRLYMSLEDATANGAGQVTLSIFPPLRSAHPSGTAIATVSTHGTFRLAGPVSTWETDFIPIYGVSFSAVEDLT